MSAAKTAASVEKMLVQMMTDEERARTAARHAAMIVAARFAQAKGGNNDRP